MGSADGPGGLLRAGRLAWSTLGIAGVLVLVSLVAGRLSLIVIPLILALFPATLLVPVAGRLQSHGVPKSLAAVASLLLGVVVIGGIIAAMVPLVTAEFPGLVDSASSGIAELEEILEDAPFGVGAQGTAGLLEAGREQLGQLGDYTGQAVSAATTAFEVLAGTALLLVILFFYLKDGRRLTEGILSLVPTRTRGRARQAADRAWNALGRYFRGQLLVALVDALFIGIGLVLLDVPLAVPLAVLIFFGALFPLIGALVTGALAVLVALADGGLSSGLIVLGLILLVQQLEGNILQPIILSHAIDLHPLVVLLSVTAGGILLGILGAFIAVPAVAIVARVLMPDPEAPDGPVEPTDPGDQDPEGDDGVRGASADARWATGG